MLKKLGLVVLASVFAVAVAGCEKKPTEEKAADAAKTATEKPPEKPADGK